MSTEVNRTVFLTVAEVIAYLENYDKKLPVVVRIKRPGRSVTVAACTEIMDNFVENQLEKPCVIINGLLG
jgi:hypothetical protein